MSHPTSEKLSPSDGIRTTPDQPSPAGWEVGPTFYRPLPSFTDQKSKWDANKKTIRSRFLPGLRRKAVFAHTDTSSDMLERMTHGSWTTSDLDPPKCCSGALNYGVAHLDLAIVCECDSCKERSRMAAEFRCSIAVEPRVSQSRGASNDAYSAREYRVDTPTYKSTITKVNSSEYSFTPSSNTSRTTTAAATYQADFPVPFYPPVRSVAAAREAYRAGQLITAHELVSMVITEQIEAVEARMALLRDVMELTNPVRAPVGNDTALTWSESAARQDPRNWCPGKVFIPGKQEQVMRLFCQPMLDNSDAFDLMGGPWVHSTLAGGASNAALCGCDYLW